MTRIPALALVATLALPSLAAAQDGSIYDYAIDRTVLQESVGSSDKPILPKLRKDFRYNIWLPRIPDPRPPCHGCLFVPIQKMGGLTLQR